VPVIDAARAAILATFTADSLHSAYLYGSVPRGTARPGVSDLDVLLALHDEPSGAGRIAATELENVLDRRGLGASAAPVSAHVAACPGDQR
jgi:predicted nucleotidyltransferase